MKSIILPALLLLFACSSGFASPPVPFAGKLSVDGINYTGEALFSFSIVDANGSALWNHADSPGQMISNPVDRGRYLVLLGGQGMNALPADLFASHDSLFVRTKVDLQDGSGPTILSPDLPITATPYSYVSELAQSAEHANVATIANGVNNGAITLAMLSQEVIHELNDTLVISRDMLPQDVLADLNRTITLSMLGQDVIQEINSSTLSAGSVNSSLLDPNLTRYFLPEILSSPSSLSALQGTSTSLSGQADGKFISYQWYRNGVALQGANGPSLSLQDLNASLDEGNYSLVVSNDWGSVTTQPATLAIATALPTIILNGSSSLTHEAATAYTDAGASANDALGADLNGSITVTGADVNVSLVGQHVVTYSVTDAGGNQNSITRSVTIADTTSPTITLTGGSNYVHGLGTTWVDPGYQAIDTLDGNLTASVSVTGSVDGSTTGTYSLNYSVTDAAGNEANVTRSVSVQPMGPWTFTNAGATDGTGPTQAQINSSYLGTSLEGTVSINVQGIQLWTLPASGTYSIEAFGAQGGIASSDLSLGGRGARMKGEFVLTSGTTLTVVVGQQGKSGTNVSSSRSGGGGGGTFVYSGSTLYVGAGGGGGASFTGSGQTGIDATTSTAGTMNFANSANGGTNGLGGGIIYTNGYDGGGGAGWNGNGGSVTYTNGGSNSSGNWIGGSVTQYTTGIWGGFGGGGGANHGAGGGGGYSGGAGGANSAASSGGGGGGSFNGGTNQNNSAGVNSGHGKVIITYVSN